MSEFTKDPSSTQRPTLLTVLCVLSFLGGIWGIWGGVQSSFTDKPYENLQEARAEMEETMSEMADAPAMVVNMMESAIELAEVSAEKAKPLGYSAIATSILGLIGVWMMWNLQRRGFPIYVVASLVGLVVPFFFLGFSLVTFIALGFGALVTVAFIIMYGVNLKHMH